MIYRLKYAKSESNFDADFEHPTCKGKSFMYCLGVLKLLPLQGDNLASITTQGAALGRH